MRFEMTFIISKTKELIIRKRVFQSEFGLDFRSLMKEWINQTGKIEYGP